MKRTKQIPPLKFFSKLKWLDGRPLSEIIEPYRQRIFQQTLYTFDTNGRPRFNLALMGRAKKNWKSADLILAALYRLLAWKSHAGNQCYILGNDLDQANDDLELGKELIAANAILSNAVEVKQRVIERRDGQGFLEILPAGDVVGTHGKTYLFCGFDEIHGYRTWDLLEAMQLDPTRPDPLQWITSYASIHHKPGVPLFDLCKLGREAKDPRMLFSWYSSTYTTDPDFENASPEHRANPSMDTFQPDYLEQQRRRLPSHKFRRLHLNEPGLPEGSAFTFEAIDGAIQRGITVRPYRPGITYFGFVDMSGGSNDDATLSICHLEGDGEDSRAVLDVVMSQGQPAPFNPRNAVTRFAKVLRDYRTFSVVGDKYAGETFINDFAVEGISYEVSQLTKSQLYEALEPRLNANRVVLLDVEKMEEQFLSLVWRANKIDHPGGEHDDFSNAAAGAIHQAFEGDAGDIKDIVVGGSFLPVPRWDGEARTPGSGNPDDAFDGMVANSPGSASGGTGNREWWP